MNILSTLKKLFFTASAIYATNDYADIAEAELTLRGIRISKLERIPIAKNIGDTAGAEINDRIDGIFKKAFHVEEKRPYRIAINVSDEHLILRRFTIRDIPNNEIEQAVVFEAQKYIPCSIESLTYGFKSHPTGNGFREIIFVASETKIIDGIANYFKERNVIPAVMEPTPILLARALNIAKGINTPGASVFIHFEPPAKVILCEISHGYPHFFMEKLLPGEAAGRADGDELPYITINSAWPFIEKDVSRGIDYLKKETAETVERIYISGFARSRDEAAVSKELGMPIERIAVPFVSGVEPEKKDRYIPILTLIHDAARKPFLNIAPKEIVANDLWGLRGVIFKSFLGLLLILTFHMLFANINAARSKKLRNLAKSFEGYAAVNPASPRSEVEVYKKGIIEKTYFVNNLVTSKHSLTERLIALGEVMPSDSWVDYLLYNNKLGSSGEISLSIKGLFFNTASRTSTGANKILEDIKQNKILMNGFGEAELFSVQKKELFKRDVTEFVINLKKTG